MTPYEVFIQISAWREERDQRQQEYLWLAWHVAAFTRSERLPRFDAVIAKSRGTVILGKDKAEAMRAQHERIVKELGGSN